MSRYIVLNESIDRAIIDQIINMDDSAEIVVDSNNPSYDHIHADYFISVSNFFDHFDQNEHVIFDVIKYDFMDDVMLATVLSDCKYVIMDISDDDLDEFESMCDYSNLETFQELIQTLDGCRSDAEEATDCDIEGALETVLDSIDENLGLIKQQYEDMRSALIDDVIETWSSHIYTLSA